MAWRIAPTREPCGVESACPLAILRLGVLKAAVNQISGESMTWTPPVSSRWTTSQPIGVFNRPMMVHGALLRGVSPHFRQPVEAHRRARIRLVTSREVAAGPGAAADRSGVTAGLEATRRLRKP